MSEKHRKTNALEPVWQRIDRIFCISLEDRKDRQAGARHQFARAGLKGRAKFFYARRHPDDSEQGIFKSHQACLKKGLDAGARHILVFEDDVVFGKIDALRLAEDIDFFLCTDGCEILFLGCLYKGGRATGTPGIRSVQYRCLSHAYLVKRSLALQLADAPWQKVPWDIMLKNCVDEPFVLFPSIAFQSNSPSDNSRHRILDAARRLLGGLRFIQIASERYHRHRPVIITAHVAAVAAAVLWIAIR